MTLQLLMRIIEVNPNHNKILKRTIGGLNPMKRRK